MGRRGLSIMLVASMSAAAAAKEPAKEGEDFAKQAAALYRVAACGGDAALPETIDAKIVDAHCKELRGFYTRYTDRWMAKAQPALAQIVPAGLPDKIVYPFGGGDLMTALATFPDASEITTISLEYAGDVRTIESLNKDELEDTLDTNRENLRRLMAVAHSKTTNLQVVVRGDLPGQLVFSLAALALYGYEPISLRYFRLNADGTLHYLSLADISAAEKEKLSHKGELELFADAEIEYRKAGDKSAPTRVFRHIAFNLDDEHMGQDEALRKHLEAKGKVTAMTKAASFLLWRDDFSKIRDYLLANMEWMISDATGILPSAAKAAGFEQETWGKFKGPFLDGIRKKKSNEMRRLWTGNPYKALTFRYGYPDNASNAHLMVTRRATPATPAKDKDKDKAKHLRLDTPAGPVHVWQPAKYKAKTAGIVIYVHGFYTDADGAWKDHALAAQFAASGRNALFIVPEAPDDATDDVSWPSLGDLLRAVHAGLGAELPRGPLVAVGHSGAWRTISGWLDYGPLDHVILLDGLYGAEEEFRVWLDEARGHASNRLTLVAQDTLPWARPFVQRLTGVVTVDAVPAGWNDLSAAARRARVLLVDSQVEHMHIISEGKILPLMLHRAPLGDL